MGRVTLILVMKQMIFWTVEKYSTKFKTYSWFKTFETKDMSNFFKLD